MEDALTAAIAPFDPSSCLIFAKDRLLFEYYRDESAARDKAKIYSCTKSVLSALLCIAFDRGLLPGPETPAETFFPALARAADERKRRITLRHLLTMTAGFEWTEFGGLNSFPRMTRSPDWVGFVLALPLSDEPGVRMEYNSGVSQLLSAVLAQAAGMPTARFAEQHLFGPLGIEDYYWERDPQGIHTGGFGLRLLPQDMLKFGRLLLQKGTWNGRRLLSAEMIAASTRTAVRSGPPRPGGYGWHWWTGVQAVAPGAEAAPAPALEYFYARGYGGQFIYVVPALEAVVVLTRDRWRKGSRQPDVFGERLLPVLAGGRPTDRQSSSFYH